MPKQCITTRVKHHRGSWTHGPYASTDTVSLDLKKGTKYSPWPKDGPFTTELVYRIGSMYHVYFVPIDGKKTAKRSRLRKFYTLQEANRYCLDTYYSLWDKPPYCIDDQLRQHLSEYQLGEFTESRVVSEYNRSEAEDTYLVVVGPSNYAHAFCLNSLAEWNDKYQDFF